MTTKKKRERNGKNNNNNNIRVKFSTLAGSDDHLQGQQLRLADVIAEIFSKLDLKNASTSSGFTISKNWSSGDSFLLHEGTLLGFRGAGGQSRILGILCSTDVGVRHSLLLFSFSSSSSSVVFCGFTATLPPISSAGPSLEACAVVLVLTVSSRILDKSCKKSRSVDMVVVRCRLSVKGWK